MDLRYGHKNYYVSVLPDWLTIMFTRWTIGFVEHLHYHKLHLAVFPEGQPHALNECMFAAWPQIADVIASHPQAALSHTLLLRMSAAACHQARMNLPR